jgi:hypothetical protein
LSKISERLSKLGQTERSGFGFGASAKSTKIPVILVGVTLAKAADARDLEADIYLLSGNSNGAAQTTPVEGADIWGVSVSGGSAEDIDAAVEAGADFIVAEGESAPGAALRDDDSGKGYIVGPEVTEDRAKAIDSGPFDFLILDGSKLELPLTVGSVLDIQEQLAKYSRHVFLSMTEIPDQGNLELLRDIGISALLYDGNSTSSDQLKALRKSIDKLEPKKQKTTAGAVLPRGAEASGSDDDFDDHDHDHDDEDWE